VSEIEAMAVGLEAEGFDFGDALDALAVQLVVEGQYSLLRPMLPGSLCRVLVVRHVVRE
jgi:hypothetical protein